MNIITQSSHLVKILRPTIDTLKYITTSPCINCDFNIDILSPQNSTLEILSCEVLKGDLGIYFDGKFNIPFIVENVEKKENKIFTLTVRTYIDIFDLVIPSQNAGLVNFKENTEKIVNVNNFLNNNVASKKVFFPKMNQFYKFEGVATTVYKWFGTDRNSNERDILEAVLKLENRTIDIGLKKMNNKDDEVTSEDYYLSCEIKARSHSIEKIRIDDSSMVLDYKLVYSNAEYNCLLMGLPQSSYRLFYMNKDGSILYEHDPMQSLPSNWLNDAQLPLKIKQVWISNFNEDVTPYDEALNDLSGQYLNHEISLTIDLKSPKISWVNLNDFIYKKFLVIDLNADVVNRTTYVTGLRYTGQNSIGLTLGYARTGFIKKLTKFTKELKKGK